MYEELEKAATPSIQLASNTSLVQSATGGIYLSYRKFLYAPNDDVPGTICGGHGPPKISARQFVVEWLVTAYGADSVAWPTLAHDFVSQRSDDK